MKSRLHVIVSGEVQGVFFRDFVKQIADELSLTGWARNTSDNTVEFVAEGDKEHLDQLLERCHKGPPAAKVDDVKSTWKKATGEFKNFEVRY